MVTWSDLTSRAFSPGQHPEF